MLVLMVWAVETDANNSCGGGSSIPQNPLCDIYWGSILATQLPAQFPGLQELPIFHLRHLAFYTNHPIFFFLISLLLPRKKLPGSDLILE